LSDAMNCSTGLLKAYRAAYMRLSRPTVAVSDFNCRNQMG
jgi:hypothetical protein